MEIKKEMQHSNMFITHSPFISGKYVYALGTDTIECELKNRILLSGAENNFERLAFFNTCDLKNGEGNYVSIVLNFDINQINRINKIGE